MAATYPMAVKSFTTKRNLFDDVEASHINDMQDEIRSLESVVGVNPHIDGGTGQQYASVAARLDDLRKQISIAVWELNKDDEHECNMGTITTINLFTINDTHLLFNGIGITIKVAGYYHINAGCFFQPNSTPGDRQCHILRSSSSSSYGNVAWAVAASGFPHTTGNLAYSDSATDCTYTGRFEVGEKLSLGVNLDSWGVAGKFKVKNSHLHGFLVRE